MPPHESAPGTTFAPKETSCSSAATEPFSVTLLGEPRDWFTLERGADDGEIVIRPKEPLPRRCTIRPAALFQQDRGFPDVNAVMGRLVFTNGTSQERRYRPYTRDPHRELREVFLPIEASPDDDLMTIGRWRMWEAIARSLCAAAGIPWKGLSDEEIDILVRFIFSTDPLAPEPLEGCLLHALAQWSHRRGNCVIEIGSFRGATLSTLALALNGADSDSPVISVDPHFEEPDNAAHVRLALRQIGEERRLVQFPCTSDRAWRFLRPGSASLIFVDGDHSYEQVVKDFLNYRDVLAPGGCMLFHDYGYGEHNGLPEANPGVRRAIDEYVFPEEGFKSLLLAHSLLAFVKVP